MITNRFLDELDSAGVEFVTVMDSQGFAERIAEGRARHGVPLVNTERGLDEEKLRDAFSNLSSELVASGEFSPRAVGDTMRQMTLLLENLVRFGGVMREMQSLLEHSEYTYRHSLDTMFISVLLAKRLEDEGKIEKLTPERLLTLATGAFFHDIGKLNVDSAIVDKCGPLTNDEFAKMKHHTSSGIHVKGLAEKLGEYIGCVDMKVVSAMCQGHHNRHDDKGYSSEAFKSMPEEFRKHEFVEILGIADAVDAMLKKRQYKDEMHPTDVAAQLANGRGTQFKADFVDSMLDILVRYPENSLVVLQDGSFGVVDGVEPGTNVSERSMKVNLVGSFTEAGKGVAGGMVECFEADIALGVGRLDQMSKRIADFIGKNPDTELARTLFEEAGRNMVRISGDMDPKSLVARLVEYIVDSDPVVLQVKKTLDMARESRMDVAKDSVHDVMARIEMMISEKRAERGPSRDGGAFLNIPGGLFGG